jgi:hypothetical protein
VGRTHARASHARNPPATAPTTPTQFATAAPVLCCAGADAVAEADAGLMVLLAALDALEDAADAVDWLEERLEACEARVEERENGVVGSMMPEIVVAILNSAVGWIAGRLVCVGTTREL